MSREQLMRAAALVGEAAETADGEAAERLSGFAGRLERMAEASRAPDHGKLATVLLKLDEIAGNVDTETAATVQAARERITEFRSTVEGV